MKINDMTLEQYIEELSSFEQSSSCSIKKTLELFNGKWRAHILFELCKKPSLRFGEIKKAIPSITNTMLTTSLRDLEEKGIVNRLQFNEIPPHVEYSLSESGKALLPTFYEIAKWSKTYAPETMPTQWSITGDPVATGNTASLYRQDDKIIKIFNDGFPDDQSLYEANKQKYAVTCGLPVPQVLDVTRIEGKQALVMEYVEGRTIGSMIFEHMEQAEHYLALSVEIQHRIHSIEANALESMHEKLSRQLKSACRLNDQQKSTLQHKLDAMSSEKKLCHGDFHVFNLLMSEDRISVIDWVDASAGDARADVCRTYLLYSLFSADLAEVYLRLYCKKSGWAKESVLVWMPIIAGARLSENVPTEDTDRLVRLVEQSLGEGAL